MDKSTPLAHPITTIFRGQKITTDKSAPLVDRVIYICKLLTELGLNPKSFIRSFLEIDDSDLKLRQSYWGIWRGWQSTFALVGAIRGELLRSPAGSLQ
ncbi:hypothetical protein PSTT_04873 [Puccinia striiformis]|uniref:Uncharacterized protein n=1 Tax=Puccinia striiformis TaxID=27350 RepID=A0A2S4VR61_9BASI|nr:hypothetical protein PSTT_04873 [Puccinia striiformis]